MAPQGLSNHDRRFRPGALLAVAGIHLALLGLFDVGPLRGPSIVCLCLSVDHSMTVVPVLPEGGDEFRHGLLDHKPEIRPGLVDSPEPPQPQFDTSAAQVTSPAIDWRDAGTRAAIDATRSNPHRSLGPKTSEPPHREKAPRSPFYEPRHTMGELGFDALGNPVLWLSENCYVRPNNYMAQPGDPFAEISMTLCSFPLGKREPRGDLFEHLRELPAAQ